MIGPVIIDITAADLTTQGKVIYRQFAQSLSASNKEK